MAAILVTVGLSTSAVAPAVAAPVPGTKATYAGEVVSNTRIDSDATIARAKALNANTYVYLVWKANEWDDLVNEFMPAAQAAGIKVWVYVTPPTEGSPPPYGADYVRWATEIAKLRVTYPNLTAWAIDDFNANVNTTFTPAYLQQMRDAANAVSPGLDLYATAYWSALQNTSFIDTYGPKLDGFIFPYRDEPYNNTMWTATASSQLTTVVANAARTGDKVFLMPYASKLSSAVVPPDVNYVKAVTQVGLTFMSQGKIPGIVEYNLPLTPGQGNGDTNRARTGSGALRFEVEPNTATGAGSYAAASTTVTLNPGSTSCSIVAFNTDTAPEGGTETYHYKQILANDHLLWERDVATDGTSWYTNSPRDLTPYLVNGKATLKLQLLDKLGVSNYPIDVSFDDIALTGCQISNSTFESPSGWTFSRSGGWVFGAVHRFDGSQYSDAVHAAVAALFA